MQIPPLTTLGRNDRLFLKKKSIKITVGKHSGFCFGVKRAYDLACVNSRNCEKLYILGKLVHNDDVCHDLKKRGVKEIKSLRDIEEGTVIFTAHGVGPHLYEKFQDRGLKIIDTTCPKVMKAQRLAQNYTQKKWQILIFGDKNHKEVKSIKEWAKNKARIIQSFKELEKIKFSQNKKYCLIAQTTQNVEEFKKIINYLKKNLKYFIFFNTICPSTDDRQKEIRKMGKNNDVVIIIGGKDSSNSLRLFEIAKKINPKTYFIENAGNLNRKWLNGIGKLGIGAGASTPEWAIKEVLTKLKTK